jgi:transcriptional regulator with XRE-family HTH domain
MGAKRNGASIRRRILARRLRELREQAGLTLEEAAPPLDSSMSKLSRIENGQQKADVHLVKSMLDLFDAGGDQWTELLTMAREAAKPGWYRAYGLGDNTYVGYETEATQVQEYAAGFVPGLLQIPDYSRVLFESGLYLPTQRSARQRSRSEGPGSCACSPRTIRSGWWRSLMRLCCATRSLELQPSAPSWPIW